MIYLVTVHDRNKKLSNLHTEKDLKSFCWKSILELTVHKTVLYSSDSFNAFKNKALPNRVNIVFSKKTKGAQKITNVLVNNNYKDLVETFGGTKQDIYVLGLNHFLVERFAKDADFIIDYSTEEISRTTQGIFDTINFADYTLLKKQEHTHFDIRYFVREKTNYIGY
ncbi:MAG: dihydrofolate reductase [Mycoplasma sp.]|nr:dihydrofolate reductase [Candidatus Hennigella equi]